MKFNTYKLYISLTMFFTFSVFAAAQREVDITKYLDQVTSGESEAVRRILPSLMKNNPQSTSLKYLQAVLTQDGRQASLLYREIVHSKQNSEFKDDALFKLYQFHYAVGEFNESDKYARMILDSYPSSPFVSRIKKTESQSHPSASLQPAQIKTETVESQTTLPSGNFTVQVGAFLDKNNAENLRSQTLKYGESWINEREVKGKIFHIVLVGKFSKEAEANVFIEKIKQEMNLNGVLIKLQ